MSVFCCETKNVSHWIQTKEPKVSTLSMARPVNVVKLDAYEKLVLLL